MPARNKRMWNINALPEILSVQHQHFKLRVNHVQNSTLRDGSVRGPQMGHPLVHHRFARPHALRMAQIRRLREDENKVVPRHLQFSDCR